MVHDAMEDVEGEFERYSARPMLNFRDLDLETLIVAGEQ